MRIFKVSLALAAVMLVTVGMLGSGCAAPATEPAAPGPAPKPNISPVISSLTAEPLAVLYGDSSKLTCIAADPDYDPIEYAWSASEGTITGSGNEVVWVAPKKEGNFNVSVAVKDSRGGQATNSVTIAVASPVQTITINSTPAETGTVDQKNATDYSRTRAGDDAQNIGYHAFWGFNISKVAGKNVDSAKLKFTTANITGKPFLYQPPGLGGLLLWKTTHGSKLPDFGYYAGGKLSTTGRFFEPPDVVDVTPEVNVLAGYNVDRFQIEALFDHTSNGNNTSEMIEWSSVVLEITYSEK